MDHDLWPVVWLYGAIAVGVCGFWGVVLWLAWRLVEWLTAG